MISSVRTREMPAWQQAFVQLFFPGTGCRTVLLKPLHSPYSQFPQLFYQSCRSFCNITPLQAIFPNGPRDDRTREPVFREPFHQHPHCKLHRWLFFQFTLFSGFAHNCDILRINNTNTSSETRVSLLSRPWTRQIHLTETLYLPRYPVKATVPWATIQRYTLYNNCASVASLTQDLMQRNNSLLNT
jgi:hypothetical protein